MSIYSPTNGAATYVLYIPYVSHMYPAKQAAKVHTNIHTYIHTYILPRNKYIYPGAITLRLRRRTNLYASHHQSLYYIPMLYRESSAEVITKGRGAQTYFWR